MTPFPQAVTGFNEILCGKCLRPLPGPQGWLYWPFCPLPMWPYALSLWWRILYQKVLEQTWHSLILSLLPQNPPQQLDSSHQLSLSEGSTDTCYFGSTQPQPVKDGPLPCSSGHHLADTFSLVSVALSSKTQSTHSLPSSKRRVLRGRAELLWAPSMPHPPSPSPGGYTLRLS